jgi:Domain of unknown function (DUF4267)
MDLTRFVTVLALPRIGIGLTPILAAGPASALLGFPRQHDTATSRLFARLFGVRDIGLGALVLLALSRPELLPFTFLFNAAHDLGDVVMIAIPMVRRQGLGRAAGLSLAFAVSGGLLWVVAWSLSPRP